MFILNRSIGIFMLGCVISAYANGDSVGKELSPTTQMIEKEMQMGLASLGAQQGLALLAEAPTGKIIARVQIGGNLKNFAPGSMCKPLMIAVALDCQTVFPQTEIDCENGMFMIEGRPLRDVVPYQKLSVSEIVAKSSNIGTAKIAIHMGTNKLIPYLKKLHIPYPENLNDKLILSQFAIGYSPMALSPEQLLGVWCKLAVDDKDIFISRATVSAISRMLSVEVKYQNSASSAGIVDGWGVIQTGTYRVASSSDYIGSCIGFIPREQPKYVLLVSIKREGKSLYGKAVVPIWKNIMAHL